MEPLTLFLLTHIGPYAPDASPHLHTKPDPNAVASFRGSDALGI